MKLQEILSKSLKEQAKQFSEIKNVFENPKGEYALRGWVYRNRGSTKLYFIVLRDGTGLIQCSINKQNVSDKVWQSTKKIRTESSVVALIGEAKKDNRAPGGIELSVSDLEVLFEGETFPIGKDQSIEFLLDVRHLWVRSQKIANMLKVKNTLIKACREFLDSKGFIEVQPPMFTKVAGESGSTLFEVNYFGRKAFLTQTGQLYSEAIIAGNPKIYVFAPSFRAEPSRTPRHLTEFWNLEPEMAFYDFEMNLELQEQLVEFFCHKIAKEHSNILQEFGRDPKDLLKIKAPFQRITYEEALKRLNKKGMKLKWGDSIGLDEEKKLVEDFDQPIFLMHLPKEIRAFYMKINPKDPRTVLDADVLAPEGIGEIIGGSERISDYKELVDQIKLHKLKEEDYQWYVDLRKYGSVPHSGFGMGTERVIRWLLKLDSIRDAIPFPRNMNRLEP